MQPKFVTVHSCSTLFRTTSFELQHQDKSTVICAREAQNMHYHLTMMFQCMSGFGVLGQIISLVP